MNTLDLPENCRILIVDDNPDIHDDFRKVLASNALNQGGLEATRAAFFQTATSDTPQASYEIDSAHQGAEAVSRVRSSQLQGRPYSLAFVDSRMPPGFDGIETIRRIWEIDARLPVVICTAYSDYTWQQMSDLLHHPSGFLVLKKPFDTVEVRQLAAALTTKWALERAVEAQTREIIATRDLTVFALAQLAESRDPETGDHLRRMRAYSQLLGEYLHRQGPYRQQVDARFLENLYRASPLHDIGKVGIPDNVLLKAGPLSADEFKIMQRHTVIGADTLQRVVQRTRFGDFLQMAIAVARSHHERFDGSGYPDGLKGSSIPLAARIVSVADVFDALTSARVYKAAMDPAQARAIVLAGAGTQFDPVVTEAFNAVYAEMLRVPEQLEQSESAYIQTSFAPIPTVSGLPQSGDCAPA